MMVLMAKLPSKLFPLACVYRPAAQVHAVNDALVVRGYKHMTGISGHAHTHALWGPWKHCCKGLVLPPLACGSAALRPSGVQCIDPQGGGILERAPSRRWSGERTLA